MDSNLIKILEKFETLKGQFVLTAGHELERLIAIGEDDMDYYYVTYDGRRAMWNSCVGGLVVLKGKLDAEDYNEFIRLAKLNHFDQDTCTMKKYVAQHYKSKIETINPPNKYLTEICWDLN